MADSNDPIPAVLLKIVRAYFNAIEILLRAATKSLGLDLSISLDTVDKKSIDERISKIDEARGNLQEALGALQELSEEAERNRSELAEALRKLHDTRDAHAIEAGQLEQIQKIAQSDVEAFRKMAGIDPTRERVIGFLAGICASLVAAAIWQLGLWLAS